MHENWAKEAFLDHFHPSNLPTGHRIYARAAPELIVHLGRFASCGQLLFRINWNLTPIVPSDGVDFHHRFTFFTSKKAGIRAIVQRLRSFSRGESQFAPHNPWGGFLKLGFAARASTASLPTQPRLQRPNCTALHDF
jgi:hypothetical protein